MTALDTNVIVRFLVRDDEKQARIVHKLFKRAEADRTSFFVPLAVTLKVIWVLDRRYAMARAEILNALACLRQMPILEFEGSEVLERFLMAARRSKVGLGDLLIAHSAQAAGCDGVVTFDKKACRSALFSLLK
jgi:predicted nucleic-acid-binding protein